jgi:hypothetical protein
MFSTNMQSRIDRFSYPITDTTGYLTRATEAVTLTETKIITPRNANILENEFIAYPNSSNCSIKSKLFGFIITKTSLFIC